MRCKQLNFIDGTPCTVKVVRTVWSGGKDGDNFKVLPITIVNTANLNLQGIHQGDLVSKHLKLLKVPKVYFTKAELETTNVSYRKIENKNRIPYAEIKALD